MTVRDMGELMPETAQAVREYLELLEAGLCEVRRELAADTVEETRTHFLDVLDTHSTPADAASVAAQLGQPDEYAAALCAEIAGRSERTGQGERRERTILGMPYEWRPPTAERVGAAWWSPTNPRVMVPRVFGIGWSINFGALAVRLHLIRPDDEEEPFASVPEGWMLAALAVPILLTLGIAVAWWLVADTLPEQVPVHWGFTGRPDRYSSAGEALGFLMAMAALPTLWAVWTHLRRRGGSRALVSTFASLFAVLAAGIFALTLAWSYGEAPGWVVLPGVLGSLAVPFAMLVVLARVNRRHEWNRELGSRRSRSEDERNA